MVETHSEVSNGRVEDRVGDPHAGVTSPEPRQSTVELQVVVPEEADVRFHLPSGLVCQDLAMFTGADPNGAIPDTTTILPPSLMSFCMHQLKEQRNWLLYCLGAHFDWNINENPIGFYESWSGSVLSVHQKPVVLI
jgi:hypothetical protein